jgi:hypothetical protein
MLVYNKVKKFKYKILNNLLCPNPEKLNMGSGESDSGNI